MKREQIKRILTDNFNAWGFTQEFFDLSTDAILALPLEVPSDEEIIYGVQYNPMIHESVFGCLSLHRSRKEAEMEMEFHKHQRMKEDDYSDVERWTIYEYKLK